jgi:hypothetical protein
MENISRIVILALIVLIAPIVYIFVLRRYWEKAEKTLSPQALQEMRDEIKQEISVQEENLKTLQELSKPKKLESPKEIIIISQFHNYKHSFKKYLAIIKSHELLAICIFLLASSFLIALFTWELIIFIPILPIFLIFAMLLSIEILSCPQGINKNGHYDIYLKMLRDSIPICTCIIIVCSIFFIAFITEYLPNPAIYKERKENIRMEYYNIQPPEKALKIEEIILREKVTDISLKTNYYFNMAKKDVISYYHNELIKKGWEYDKTDYEGTIKFKKGDLEFILYFRDNKFSTGIFFGGGSMNNW